ncbi:hypothetical protein [Sphingomonas morindae]|uniref:Uncharacterized protein n=1 Tax=Sphingomonas morindae TaxID=1541170 RepID=A0ABY4X6J0_9SPHN|nr:hypothetical protein [Sphingomonas morindae]USI72522.1 hypothetical protein LHA26_14705 [Sphingomonas morindae]
MKAPRPGSAWRGGRATRRAAGGLPPMGQGLVVIAALALIALLSALAIGSYLLSLHVAAARDKALALDQRIARAGREVAVLRRDLAIRGRYVELERWGDRLGLAPADARHYAADRGGLLHAAAALAAEREARDPCGVGVDCAVAGGGRRSSYTPRARQALDSLIDKIG